MSRPAHREVFQKTFVTDVEHVRFVLQGETHEVTGQQAERRFA